MLIWSGFVFFGVVAPNLTMMLVYDVRAAPLSKVAFVLAINTAFYVLAVEMLVLLPH